MTPTHAADAPTSAGALIRRPTGFLPFVMSIAALAMIVWYVAAHSLVHQADEGCSLALQPSSVSASRVSRECASRG
jgi:hypothetical protein